MIDSAWRAKAKDEGEYVWVNGSQIVGGMAAFVRYDSVHG